MSRLSVKKKPVILIVLIAIAAIIVAYILTVNLKLFTDISVKNETRRSDTLANRYMEFGDNILKFSNDGIALTTVDNTIIWNQTFEMNDPLIVQKGNYTAIADKSGKSVYVMDQTGLKSQIDVNMPLIRIDISDKGDVALLMREEKIVYLALYSVAGEVIAEGAVFAEASGVPVDIALSSTGEVMAISLLNITEGKTDTEIRFYSFGQSGQKTVDNVIASFVYEDMIMPDIVSMGSSMYAFGDKNTIGYSVGSSVKEAKTIEYPGELKSVYYDNRYFALLFKGDSNEISREVRIFDANGAEKTSFETDRSYGNMLILDNKEVCFYEGEDCAIYSFGGRQRFEHSFDENIKTVIHDFGKRQYTFILERNTVEGRFKLFTLPEKQEKRKTLDYEFQSEDTTEMTDPSLTETDENAPEQVQGQEDRDVEGLADQAGENPEEPTDGEIQGTIE